MEQPQIQIQEKEEVMEMPPIRIKYVITDAKGNKLHEGTYNYTDIGERRACAERFNACLLEGNTVTTRRVK